MKKSAIYKIFTRRGQPKLDAVRFLIKANIFTPRLRQLSSLRKTQLSRAENVVFLERITLLAQPVQHKHISQQWVPRVGAED
jgi:hypothetical protein